MAQEKDEFDDDDVPAQVDKSEATSAELAGFFKEVEQLKNSMEDIGENIASIKSLYGELLTATSTEQGKGKYCGFFGAFSKFLTAANRATRTNW